MDLGLYLCLARPHRHKYTQGERNRVSPHLKTQVKHVTHVYCLTCICGHMYACQKVDMCDVCKLSNNFNEAYTHPGTSFPQWPNLCLLVWSPLRDVRLLTSRWTSFSTCVLPGFNFNYQVQGSTILLLLLLLCTPRSLGRLSTITRRCWCRGSASNIGLVGPPGVLVSPLAGIVGFQK